MMCKDLKLPGACLCPQCGFYKDQAGSCPVVKLASLKEGDDCPVCGSWIEPQEVIDAHDREWERIQGMSEDECRAELEEAGIDVDRGLESVDTVVKLCKQVNSLEEKQKVLRSLLWQAVKEIDDIKQGMSSLVSRFPSDEVIDSWLSQAKEVLEK